MEREKNVSRKQGLADQLANELVDDIARGIYQPGSMLPSENELAEQAGVSRLTVREAVKTLQTKGVLEVKHGRGTSVKPFSNWSPFDPALLLAKSEHSMGAGALPEKLIEARRLVEVGAAELAAARRTDADLLAMSGTLERMKRSPDDIDAFAAADIDFHKMVMVAAANAFISSLFDPLGELVWATRRQTKKHPEIRAHALVAHESIFNSIRAQDPEGARQAMQSHLAQTKEDLEAYCILFRERSHRQTLTGDKGVRKR